MKKNITEKILVSGNTLYFFIFLGFLFFTNPNPVIFHKYSLLYILGLLFLLFLLIPYNLFLLFLTNNSLSISIGKKRYKIIFWQRCLIAMFFLCVMFLSAELFLRTKQNPQVVDFHPFLQSITTKEFDSKYHINSDNFRYDEITKEKPKDTYRIFITGGSTVFDEWKPYEKNIVKQVEDLVRTHYPNKKIQVINAGYNRYTSEHTLILYQTKITEFHPDLIVVWQGFNDLYHSCTPTYLTNGNYKSDYSNTYDSVANVVNAYFNFQPKSYVLDIVYKAFNEKFYRDIRGYLPSFNKTVEQKEVSMDFPSVHAYARNMTYLVKAIKSDNVNLIVGNQANIYNKKGISNFSLAQGYCLKNGTTVNGQSLIKAMELINQASKQIAEENNVPFVDIESQVPKISKNFTDDVHYTDDGDKLVAKVVYDAIVKTHYIDDF